MSLGVLLALGRSSQQPVVRALCAGFVEAMRSVPLLAVLFVAATLAPMFLPPGWDVGLFTRALVAFDVHTHMFTTKWLELLQREGGIYNIQTRPDGRREIFRGNTPVVLPPRTPSA